MRRSSVADALSVALLESVDSSASCERVGVDAVHIPTWERHLQVGGEALLRRTYEGLTKRLAKLAGGPPDD